MANVMSVLFPAYFYPSSCDYNTTTGVMNPTCSYSPLFDTIQQNPSLSYTVIVNPNKKESLPADNWQDVVSYLRYLGEGDTTISIIGYVDSAWGDRDIDSWRTEVSTYADWASITQLPGFTEPVDVHLDGIFVDDVPSDDGSRLDYQDKYQQYTDAVRDIMPVDSPLIMLNPGEFLPAPYYSMAQQIVTYEQSYGNITTPGNIFDSKANAERPSPCDNDSCPPQQQTIIIHTFDGDDNQLDQLVNDVAGRGDANIFITDVSLNGADGTGSPYESFPFIWDKFIAAVSKAEIAVQQSSDNKTKRRAINFIA